MSSVKKITLESGDGQSFEVDDAVATKFHFKQLIKDDCSDNRIRLPKVRSHILAKVMEYCKKHVDSSANNSKTADEELKAWGAEFVRVDPDTLCELISAASDLKIKGLMDLTAKAIAALIRGKTVDEIRETFNITSEKPSEAENIEFDRELDRLLRMRYERAIAKRTLKEN